MIYMFVIGIATLVKYLFMPFITCLLICAFSGYIDYFSVLFTLSFPIYILHFCFYVFYFENFKVTTNMIFFLLYIHILHIFTHDFYILL